MKDSLIATKEVCRICSGSATYKNFGVYTCFSCKVFFKRHAENPEKSRKCCYDGHCQISIHQCRTCSYCRLQKCFQNGMQMELFRPSRTKKDTCHQTKVTHHEASKSIARLNKDKSLLSFDQWILLSNLIHSYDQSKLCFIVQRLLVEERIGTVDSILVKNIFKEFHQIASRYLCSNADCYNLSSDDRSSLLRSAIENLTCLGWAVIWKGSHISQSHSFCDHLKQLYEEGSLPIIENFIKLLDSDTVLIKLALSLFAFSNNSLIFSPNQSIERTNPMAILKIENAYAELTWKYLLYKYGQYEAILRFTRLAQCLLAATESISKAQDLQLHNNLIDDIVEQTELSLILDDIKRL